MIAGKVWGKTKEIFKNANLEFHSIHFKGGYQCSEHRHQSKSNGFYVVTGKMKVKVWQNEYEHCDETILEPGDFTIVKPGLFHQFVGLEDGIAFELYWADLLHDDIERLTTGGKV